MEKACTLGQETRNNTGSMDSYIKKNNHCQTVIRSTWLHEITIVVTEMALSMAELAGDPSIFEGEAHMDRLGDREHEG